MHSGLSLFGVIDVNGLAFVHFSGRDKAELAVDVYGAGIAFLKGQIDMLAVVLRDHFIDDNRQRLLMIFITPRFRLKKRNL